MLGQVALAPGRAERRAKGSVEVKAEADAMTARRSTVRTMLGSGGGAVKMSSRKQEMLS